MRLYRFDGPVADWHSFRQSDTNAVSVIFARDGIDLLHPRYFDISNVQSGKDNPLGYRFVEFPIYNAAQAGMFELFGNLTLEQWGRLISIFATLAGAFFVYLLTKKYAGEAAGFFSAFFYLFLPFSIFYGRTILPDPSMTASILAGIYFFDSWLSKKGLQSTVYSLQFGLAILFTALAFLLKPYALFFTLPMVYLAFRQFGSSILKQWQLWLFAVFTLAPLIAWRVWIGHYPEGIPVSAWLFNGNDIRFRPAFFRWIFYERITKLIMGYVGILLLACGVFALSLSNGWQIVKHRNAGFFLSFAASSLVYLVVIATGNVQHDYYQILIIPTISMFAALGVVGLFKFLRRQKEMAILVCAVIVGLSFYFSWMQVRDYFNINDRGMVAAALSANKILPKDATIIAPYDGSTTFLNLIQRRGWPVFAKSIEELTRMGAEYLVLANPTPNDFSGFGKTYEHVASSSTYLILKLK